MDEFPSFYYKCYTHHSSACIKPEYISAFFEVNVAVMGIDVKEESAKPDSSWESLAVFWVSSLSYSQFSVAAGEKTYICLKY